MKYLPLLLTILGYLIPKAKPYTDAAQKIAPDIVKAVPEIEHIAGVVHDALNLVAKKQATGTSLHVAATEVRQSLQALHQDFDQAKGDLG